MPRVVDASVKLKGYENIAVLTYDDGSVVESFSWFSDEKIINVRDYIGLEKADVCKKFCEEDVAYLRS